MTDDQIEDLLRRFEPRGPNVAVGARIVAAAEKPRSVTLGAADYRLLLAAAVFILAMILSDPETPGVPGPSDVAWRAEVAAAAALLGGDDRALELAESLVPPPRKAEYEEDTW